MITKDMNYKKILFSPCKIKNKYAPNRIVSQPMEANDADTGGKVSERALNRYKELAKGEWGIVIVEALSVTETFLGRKNGMIINKENIDGYKRLVEEFKNINKDSLLLFQITHSGRKSGYFSEKTSICPDPEDGVKYLSADEIEGIRLDFVNGVLLTEEAGADGVDFKLCHGYFGAEMLRPANCRNDKWGGSFENRTRFLKESINEIKIKLKDPDFILGSRISIYEAIQGGCGTAGPDETVEDLTEMMELIKLMDKIGMNYVNISAGIPGGEASEVTRPEKHVDYFSLQHFRYARLVKNLLKGLGSEMKVIGSAYSALKEEALICAGKNIQKEYTNFAGFGRQSFADPLFPEKIKNNEKINYCIACSGCSKLMAKQLNDGCVVFNDYYKNLYKSVNKNG